MRYRAPGFWTGLLISSVATAVWLVLYFGRARIRRPLLDGRKKGATASSIGGRRVAEIALNCEKIGRDCSDHKPESEIAHAEHASAAVGAAPVRTAE
jgi:hypothetical protein